MAEMTLEQKRALALARARAAAAAGAGGSSAPQAANASTPPSEGLEDSQRMGNYGPFMAGVAQSGIKNFMGLKSLLMNLSDQDKKVLEGIKEEADQEKGGDSWLRTGGDVAGNVALTAIPAGKAATALSGTKAMLAAGRASPYLLAAATSGGQGVLLDPSEKEGIGNRVADKLEQGGVDALWGAGMTGAGQILKKALTRPFTPTKETENLIAKDIVPTLQQGAESGWGKFIGGLTSAVTDPRKRQNQEVIAEYLRRTAPGEDFSGMNVPEIVSGLKARFTGDKTAGTLGEYGDLFDGKKFTMSNQDRSAIWQAARGKPGMQQDARAMATQAMSGTGNAMNTNNPINMGSAKMSEYRNLLQDQIDNLSGDGVMERQAKAALQAAKNKFDDLVRNKSLTPDELQKLMDINERYINFNRFQDAASNPSSHINMKASDLLRSFANASETSPGFSTAQNATQRELLEPAARVMGLNDGQNETRAFMTGVKRVVQGGAAVAAGGASAANPALAAILGPLYATSLAGQTKTGAKVLFGETDAQKKMAGLLRQSAPYLYNSGQTMTPEN